MVGNLCTYPSSCHHHNCRSSTSLGGKCMLATLLFLIDREWCIYVAIGKCMLGSSFHPMYLWKYNNEPLPPSLSPLISSLDFSVVRSMRSWSRDVRNCRISRTMESVQQMELAYKLILLYSSIDGMSDFISTIFESQTLHTSLKS